MMIKISRLIVALTLLLSSVSFFPAGQVLAATEGDYEYTESNGKITITNYTGSAKAVSIPLILNLKTVTSIGGETNIYGEPLGGAFKNKQLTSVTLPTLLTSIGPQAFWHNQLTTVTIPNNVTSIGEDAFRDNLLTKVNFFNGSLTSIGMLAFAENQLTTVTIPDSVTSIGESAFRKNNLTTVTIPNSVTSIGAHAFSTNQLTTVTIPNSVTSIGNQAFQANQLTTVYIPKSVTSIGDNVFAFSDIPLTIIGYNPSVAKDYAEANGHSFKQTNNTISYNKNEATTGTIPTDTKVYALDEDCTVLPQGTLSRTGHTFTGWNSKPDGTGTDYQVGTKVKLQGFVTLYAQWTAPKYTVTYNGNVLTGGLVPTDSQSYLESASVTVLGNTGNLVKTGHTFAGWNTKADGTGTPYAANATFPMGTANVTLYAKWIVATTAPTVTTNTSASSITTTGATIGGNVTSDGGAAITERGMVYSTSANPTTSNTKKTATGTTGAFTVNLSGLSPNTKYYYRAYATNAVDTSYGSDQTFTTLSNNANLSNVTLSAGTLSPTFASGTTSYTASVANGVTSVKVTPTVADSKATVTVKGASVTSGQASTDISLSVGANPISVVVTAEDNSKKTYTITVTRAADTESPTLSSGIINSSNVSTTGVTLGWTKATDTVTAQGDLEYRVYRSSSNNMGTVSNIEANGTAIGSGFSKDIATLNVTGLSPSTTYYFNVMVKDEAGNKTAYTTKQVTTTSPTTSPNVTTNTSASSISTTGATIGGNVTSDGGATITERGIVYATSTNPTTSNSKATASGTTGAFTANLSGLNPNTTYHYRAYATNAVGTSYGSDQTFTTLSNNANLSNVTLSAGTLSPTFASGTTSYTASVANGITSVKVTPIVADSKATVTVKGASVTSGQASTDISLSVGANPISVVVTAEDNSKKTYTITVTRAADTESPTLSSGIINSSNVSTTGVTLGWTKATDTVTAQGDLEYRVYRSSSNNMGTVSNIEANGTALGSGFTKDLAMFNVTGLSPGTTYYFNVIVKDAVGNKTAYTTKQVTTTSPTTSPNVTTNTSASSISTTGATIGGNVTSDGGATITERGIVYATSTNPTTSNSKATASGTTGAFTANLSGLNPNTTYHYRAYATNAVGTSYGSDQTFTTLSNNANLSNVTLSAGTLSPTFASGTTSYTASVANGITSVKVTPIVADSKATVTVKGASVTSGQASTDISLSVGANPISVVVTAEDNSKKTYTITVTRAADTESPTLSSGIINSSNVSTTGVTLGWTKATDTVTAQGDLEYRVYRSSSNNMGTVSNIEANGTALGSGFTKDLAMFNVTGLSPGTTYYFNVIVKDAVGNKTAYTTKQVTTTSPTTSPNVTTNTSASSITTTGATIGGNVTSDGGATITERGMVYSTSANPTTSNTKKTATGTTGAFTVNLSGLSPNTTYYYRAFATNAVDTSYGSDQTFTTLSNNANLSNVTLSAGTLSPTFASGTTSYTASVANGVTSVKVTPTVADSKATVKVNNASVTSGQASTDIPLAVGSNTISVVVTAEDNSEKTYTITVTRAADTAPPTVSSGTISSSNVNTTGVTLGWTKATDNITAQGDLEYRIYRSSSNNMGTVSNIEANGTALGSGFTKDLAMFNVTGLSANTSYHFNVIVKDAVGNKSAYTTKQVTTASPTTSPNVTTNTSASSITTTGATIGGNVTSDGGATITERGMVYSTSANPTTSNTKKTATGTTGAFTVNLSGLSPNTKYYYRAFATNAVDTSYGSDQTFTTNSITSDPIPLTGTGSIAIRVLNDDKKTAITEPLQVKITDKSGRVVTNANDTLSATGTFTSSNKLAKGTYYVTISDGTIDQTTEVRVSTKQASVKLIWESTVAGLKDDKGFIKKSGAITGIVYDGTTDTATAVANATVKVLSKKTTWSVKTDKNGVFHVYVPTSIKYVLTYGVYTYEVMTYDIIIEGKDTANTDDKKNILYKKVKVTAGQASAPLQQLNAGLSWGAGEKNLGFTLTEASLKGSTSTKASKAFTGKALAYSIVSVYTVTSDDTTKTWVAETKTKKTGDFSVRVPVLAGERVLFTVQDEAGNVYKSAIKEVPKIDAPTLSASAVKGTTVGTTKITATKTKNKDHKILVIVSNAATPTPKLGDLAPTISDSAIAFVDNYESKKEMPAKGATYAAVYEVSATGKIMKFKDVPLTGKIKE